MDDIELKDVMNGRRKRLEAFYYFLWELLTAVLTGAVFWLIYKCVIWPGSFPPFS